MGLKDFFTKGQCNACGKNVIVHNLYTFLNWSYSSKKEEPPICKDCYEKVENVFQSFQGHDVTFQEFKVLYDYITRSEKIYYDGLFQTNHDFKYGKFAINRDGSLCKIGNFYVNTSDIVSYELDFITYIDGAFENKVYGDVWMKNIVLKNAKYPLNQIKVKEKIKCDVSRSENVLNYETPTEHLDFFAAFDGIRSLQQ